jgi:hypothetical protein
MTIKLSNAQVSALADKIIEAFKTEIVLPVRNFNKAIDESPEYLNFYESNEDCKTITAIQQKIGSDPYYFGYVRSEIRRIAFADKYQKEPSLSNSKVISEIHLATIDAADVESLIKAVSAKFR